MSTFGVPNEDVAGFEYGDHVRVETRPGVAHWWVEECPDGHLSCSILIMVGDDRRLHTDNGYIKGIDREEFCGNCGQIGCPHG